MHCFVVDHQTKKKERDEQKEKSNQFITVYQMPLHAINCSFN